MVVIAEGIEDAVTFDLLRDMGCDMAQGYYIGMPVPADEFIANLSRQSLPQPLA
jgi:EAL domain-containing protein (putative c-di-GMP-specific phosphodiesterase class I)